MIGKVGVFSRDWTLVTVLVLQLFFSYCVTDLQHFGFVDQVFTGQYTNITDGTDKIGRQRSDSIPFYKRSPKNYKNLEMSSRWQMERTKELGKYYS